jgi:hypothetical protein
VTKRSNDLLKTHSQSYEKLSVESSSLGEKLVKAGGANAQEGSDRNNELSSLLSKIDELLDRITTLRSEIENDSRKANDFANNLFRSESQIEYRVESLKYLARRISSLNEEATLSASLEGMGEIKEGRSESARSLLSQEVPYPRNYPESAFGVPAPEPPEFVPSERGEDLLLRQLNSRLKKLGEHIRSSELENSELEANLLKSKEGVTSLQSKEKALQTEATKLDQTAQSILETLGTRIKILRDQRAKHERDLQERDAALNQFEINRLLVYAVYGMVASIVVLFVLLRWYPASLTGLIVEQRVFVEVLSMGFLLVTVIILGSGKLIMGEGLAGLLGTIAGYIFAKKATELLASDRQGATAGAIERQLVDAYLKSSEAEVSLNALKAKYGPTPTEEQKADIAKAQAALDAESARAEKLTASLDVMAKLRQRPNDLATGGR